MNKKQKKIVYLNVVMLIAFLSAIILVFTFIFTDEKDVSVLVGEICSPIIVGTMAFWTYELKHLFADRSDHVKKD